MIAAALIFVAVAGATAAMSLRNVVHCVLALTVAFAGIAGIYLDLGAQFLGFAQILAYVGAVAILAVFAIMVTYRPGAAERGGLAHHWWASLPVAAGVFAVVAGAIRKSLPAPPAGEAPVVSVQQLGEALMSRCVLPLELVGLLLTAALIGAVVIAMQPRERRR